MKINLNQIPLEGLILEESVSPVELDLETEEIKFRGDLKVKLKVLMITNAVCIDADLSAKLVTQCSRCLEEANIDFNKKLKLNYQVSASERFLDIGPDIREEIILDYPVKFLCRPDCKGLCPKCGKSLNEGGCNCGST